MADDDMRLLTPRLILRPTQPGDAGRAFEIQSDWAVTRMLRMAPFPPDRGQLDAWFADHAGEWARGDAYRFAVEREGRMIGLADLDEIQGPAADLGYWLEQPAWGQGYASEAAGALVGFAFGHLGLKRLRSGHADDNPASGRVLHKLGFRVVDTVSIPSMARGQPIRQRRYELDA